MLRITWLSAPLPPSRALHTETVRAVQDVDVTGGPDSFVLEVHDVAAFSEAMPRMLVTEIAATPRRNRLATMNR